MLTPFGKELRKLRIDQNKTLKDMAEYANVTSAYLSAVETGKKKITNDLIEKVVAFLNADKTIVEKLKDAAWNSMQEFKLDVSGKNETTRETVAMFARNFSELPDEKLKQIKQLLEDH